MARREIIDVSSYQGVPNFAAIKAAHPGLSGVIIKATEGNWEFTNPSFDAQVAAAKAAGLAIGFYTFIHPGIAGTSDAQLFLNRIAGLDPELGVWLDCEVSDGVPESVMLGRLLEDAKYIEAHYPMKCGFYTAGWWWNPNVGLADMSGWPLWVAGYTTYLPTLPEGFKTALMWQYTDNYYGLGIDGSVFLGTDDQWAWLVSGKPAGQVHAVIPFSIKTKYIQLVVHVNPDGVFGPETDRRVMGLRAMKDAVGRANHDEVKYAQQVLAFPGASANGVWDKNTQAKVITAFKKIQTALGVPATGTWDTVTDFAFLVINPLR